MSTLNIDNLSICYGDSFQLRVSCQLNTGRLWQIVGANATGKTSLITNFLYGNQSKSSCITIDKVPVSRLAIGALDYNALFLKWTVRQNLSYYLPNYSKSNRNVYLEHLVEERWLSKKAHHLSNAQKKKLLIAILLEQGHRVLLLDELDDAFDSTNLTIVLNTLNKWVEDSSDRIVLFVCKNPIESIHTRLDIVPSDPNGVNYEVRIQP